MIYWFIGQPSSGKTKLSKRLASLIGCKNHIDGDNLREVINNKDYTLKGRVYNVDIAQKIALFLSKNGEDVVVSLVTPYIDQREEFKTLLGNNIMEVFIHAEEPRERDSYSVKGFQKPEINFIDINTTYKNEDESFLELIKKIKK